MTPESDQESRLRLDNVTVSFGGVRAVNGVSFQSRPGFLGIIGPNGSGKTTILNVISGYVRPQSGQVLLDGASITGVAAYKIARRSISRTFQTPRLVRELSVLENVLLGVDGRPGRWRSALSGSRRLMTTTSAEHLLDHFGLGEWTHRSASELPLATMKIVEVVRALLAEPRIVMLDEPAAGLGAEDIEHLIPPLVAQMKLTGLSVLLIEHDVELITRLCDWILVLDFGSVIAEGPPATVLKEERVITAYLGAGIGTAVS